MKVCIIGSGYVGLVAGAGFAEIGHKVRCVDIDSSKIDALNRGEVPIYEPGLDGLIERNAKADRLYFSTDIAGSVAVADVVIIAVGTPEREDGSADLTYILRAAKSIGPHLQGFTVVACKSTVPVGTNEKIREVLTSNTDAEFAVVSNPEFLREGEAIEDFMNPPRVVIGTDSERAEEMMRSLYAPLYGYFDAQDRIINMDIRSAELTKYVANAFLATRITFISEMANLCEKVGADVTKVRVGAGTDPRIGLHYFYPGCGYGGSCFPKDVQALLRTAKAYENDLSILEAVDSANDRQKLIPFYKVRDALGGSVKGKTVAVWGLAFKHSTDDIRESAAIYIIKALIENGATVRAHDPIATDNFKRLVTDIPQFFDDRYEAARGSDALVIVTDWEEYTNADLLKVDTALAGKTVVDGRNVWATKEIPSTWNYTGIGLGTRL